MAALRGAAFSLLGIGTMAPGSMPKKHASDMRRAAIGLAVGSLLAIVACAENNGSTPCLPEDVERCTCDDGSPGFTVCPADGGGDYGPCECDLDASPYLPEAGVEASAEAGEAEEGGAGGGPGWMDPCSTAAGAPPCPTGDTCWDYPSKGPHCSKSCKEATDCPPPSPGCNPQGECKAP